MNLNKYEDRLDKLEDQFIKHITQEKCNHSHLNIIITCDGYVGIDATCTLCKKKYKRGSDVNEYSFSETIKQIHSLFKGD